MELISFSETLFSLRTTPRCSPDGRTSNICWLLACLFFDCEDEGDMCIRNVVLDQVVLRDNPDDA
jgi:hypothetical protein